jgi:hypothetical protein
MVSVIPGLSLNFHGFTLFSVLSLRVLYAVIARSERRSNLISEIATIPSLWSLVMTKVYSYQWVITLDMEILPRRLKHLCDRSLIDDPSGCISPL